MADAKISALSASTYLDGAEELPIAQAGANEKATVSQVLGGAYVVLQSNYTLTSQTAAQKLFNSSTNGAVTLATGIYEFDALIYITSMSATSGNGAFSFAGTATLARQLMIATGVDSTTPATAATQSGAGVVGASAFTTNTVLAATGTAMTAHIRGTIDVTATGTVIPSMSQVTAAAAVVNAGSFIRFRRIGPTATATLGNWS